MGLFSRKKKRSSSERYSVTADRSMIRWEYRYCNKCGRLTSHRDVMQQGAGRAVVSCMVCRAWGEKYW